MPVCKWSRFLAHMGRTDGTGRDQSKVVQVVFADLKIGSQGEFLTEGRSFLKKVMKRSKMTYKKWLTLSSKVVTVRNGNGPVVDKPRDHRLHCSPRAQRHPWRLGCCRAQPDLWGVCHHCRCFRFRFVFSSYLSYLRSFMLNQSKPFLTAPNCYMTRFQLILQVQSQKPPNFKVVKMVLNT